jgi:hypothetical protein
VAPVGPGIEGKSVHTSFTPSLDKYCPVVPNIPSELIICVVTNDAPLIPLESIKTSETAGYSDHREISAPPVIPKYGVPREGNVSIFGENPDEVSTVGIGSAKLTLIALATDMTLDSGGTYIIGALNIGSDLGTDLTTKGSGLIT